MSSRIIIILTPLNTVNRDLRIYVADEKKPANPRQAGQCVFVRRVTHSTDLNGGGAERLFDKALDALEMAQLDARVKPTSSTSLFLTIIPPIIASDVKSVDAAFKDIVGGLVASRAARLLAARVDEIQIKLYVAQDEEKRKTFTEDPEYFGPVVATSPLPPQTTFSSVRCVASSGGGPWLQLKTYVESVDSTSNKNIGYCDVAGENCVLDPYPTADVVAKKRASARRVGTTYAYDFVGLLASATLASWTDRVASVGGSVPPVDELVEAKELLLDDDAAYGVSTDKERAVGTNDVGMVAWDCNFKTPEYPEGHRARAAQQQRIYREWGLTHSSSGSSSVFTSGPRGGYGGIFAFWCEPDDLGCHFTVESAVQCAGLRRRRSLDSSRESSL